MEGDLDEKEQEFNRSYSDFCLSSRVVRRGSCSQTNQVNRFLSLYRHD